MCWGLWYKIPGAVFFYLYITGNIFLSGSFWIVIGGLYWKRANSVGAYSALILGAATSLLYFFLPHPDEWAGRLGFLSFLAGFLGMGVGSLVSTYFARVKERVAWLASVPLVALAAFILSYFRKTYGTWANLWVAVLCITILTFIAFSIYALVKGIGDMHNLLRPRKPGETDSGKPPICATDPPQADVNTTR